MIGEKENEMYKTERLEDGRWQITNKITGNFVIKLLPTMTSITFLGEICMLWKGEEMLEMLLDLHGDRYEILQNNT